MPPGGSLLLYVGTSGFSYKEWKGSFYPEKMPSHRWLTFYSQHLRSVELNNTFYRMPSRKAITAWEESVGDEFRFAVKASRRITHFKRLKDVESELEYVYGNLELLGDKLGIVLFQLPPNFPKDIERLKLFLMQMPPHAKAAFEFRHDSWFDEETLDVLRAHKLALCLSDEGELDPGACQATAPYGYLRLRRDSYSPQELQAWCEMIKKTGWEAAFVFFKHESQAPQLALDFLQEFKK